MINDEWKIFIVLLFFPGIKIATLIPIIKLIVIKKILDKI